jgi:predicted alpha/beta-hydrolase family hydrolase
VATDVLHVYLGHGASGTAASMAPHVEGLHRRGYAATAVELPKRKAEEAIEAFRSQINGGRPIVIGGHSYGGRVASLLAGGITGTERGAGKAGSLSAGPVAALPRADQIGGLVLFSYPLHRPGGPEIGLRSAHFANIRCPVLLLSGEADPFAQIDLLRQAVEMLPKGELITYPRLGHGLLPVLDDALDRTASFLASVSK